MAADTTKSVQHILERSLVALNAASDDPEVVFNDLKVEDDLHVVGDLTVDGAVSLAAGADLVFDDLSITGPFELGVDNAERASVKGIYLFTLAVTIPTIADAESDTVAVSTSAWTFAAAVGDLVVASPAEALPTSCIFSGAYVTATDEVTFAFDTLEGGAGVTGAAKNFSVLVIDVT